MPKYFILNREAVCSGTCLCHIQEDSKVIFILMVVNLECGAPVVSHAVVRLL